VTLNWTAPGSNGGSVIQGYDVYVSRTPGGENYGNPVNFNLIGGTTYTVTGLTHGTKYYFTVEAVNAVGNSAPSTETSQTP
jgi:predicted phage tail protein